MISSMIDVLLFSLSPSIFEQNSIKYARQADHTFLIISIKISNSVKNITCKMERKGETTVRKIEDHTFKILLENLKGYTDADIAFF